MQLLNRIAKLVRLRFGLPFARRADRARDRGDWIDAVVDYRRAADWMPWRQDLYVQIGNCLKEFGDHRGAIRAYSTINRGPSLSEARKQTADANRRAGTIFLPFAIAESSDALGQTTSSRAVPSPSERSLPNRIRIDTHNSRDWLGSLGQDHHVGNRLRGAGYAAIKLDQVGTMVLARDGAQEPVLAGVVAIRGRISALGAIESAEVQIGEGEGAFRDRVTLRALPNIGPLRLYVFNHWIDCDRAPRGHHWLSVNAGNKITPSGLFVNVADYEENAGLTTSNSFVRAPNSYQDLEAAIIAAPASVRPARRTLFDRPITSILALRVDQLGDVSASLAALARLRAVFAHAHLTVLAQPSVHAVIAASGICDEILSIELDYDPDSGRRSLSETEVKRLSALLTPRALDLAIDLSPGDESRPLLLLTDAVYLVGFNPDRFTFLDFGIATRTRDKINQLEKLPHGASVMMLVEALAIAATPGQPSVPRDGEFTARPSDLNLRAQRYVVLHLGARHAINRWPATHFDDLCTQLLEQTAYDVVVFAGGALPVAASANSRVQVFDVIDPDQFDWIVSNAKAMVGNDSGPKHLAAARGVPIVSIHVDRLNWNEWGQDALGSIVSKAMPCTGCGLNDINLCGREAICVRSITVEEVFEALVQYL